MTSTESSGGSSARHGTKLKSLLPKALLYDNVSLAQRLDREITSLSLEERKSIFTFSQMQRRFITAQAMKEEVHGMNLFPVINPKQPTKATKPVSTMLKSQTLIDFRIPPLLSPTDQVAKANTTLCESGRQSEPLVSPFPPPTRVSGTRRRSRRTTNPLRDSRYVKLHGLLTDLPRNIEHRLYIANYSLRDEDD